MKINAKDIIMPTSILVVVAGVFTALVVGTNGLTEEKIAVLNQQTADAAKMEVLPAADSFETETVAISSGDVEYYEAANGAGYVFSTSYKSYGGALVVMTGISAEGEITGVKVTTCGDTPGLGLKCQEASFQDQYKGALPEGGAFQVTKTGEAGKIDAISGATITTNAVTNSVNYAIEAFNQLTGGAN